jgi:hypothetical protein
MHKLLSSVHEGVGHRGLSGQPSAGQQDGSARNGARSRQGGQMTKCIGSLAKQRPLITVRRGQIIPAHGRPLAGANLCAR